MRAPSWLTLVKIVMVAVAVIAITVVVVSSVNGDLFSQGILQAIVGSAALLITIGLLTTVFSQLNLTSPQHALGLPRGSVRALIALILILVFVIFSSIIFRTLDAPPRIVTFRGLTQQQVAALPGPVISQSVEAAAASASPTGSARAPTASPSRTASASRSTSASASPSATDSTDGPAAAVYDGAYEADSTNAEARALGTQIVTALITLVTAVSAFYFGSGNARDANRRNSAWTLRITDPNNSPYRVPRNADVAQDVTIVLAGTALESGGVTAVIASGDVNGSIATAGKNTYTYHPSGPNVFPVVITFTSTLDPQLTARIELV